jgi:hypothetical protein
MICYKILINDTWNIKPETQFLKNYILQIWDNIFA